MLGHDIHHHLDMHHERDARDTHSPGQTDMQTELAKQVAAQAIEAAVAHVQANADRQEAGGTEACGQVSNGNQRDIHMREEPHLSNSQHHPRQPVFPVLDNHSLPCHRPALRLPLPAHRRCVVHHCPIHFLDHLHLFQPMTKLLSFGNHMPAILIPIGKSLKGWRPGRAGHGTRSENISGSEETN